MKFFLLKNLRGTPFTSEISIKLFRKFGFSMTDKIHDASLIISYNYKYLVPYALLYPNKKFLVWTNEPRFDTTFQSKINFPFNYSEIIIMNVFGTDVFWHNLHFVASYHFDNSNNLGIDITKEIPHVSYKSYQLSNKINKTAAFFTNTLHQKTALIKDGLDIDLTRKRCMYALEGNRRNCLDIFGNKWEDGIAMANSGYGFEKGSPWWMDKIELLKSYKFNLCLENTAFGFYTTEKLWHSIHSATLPIYSSLNSNIYTTFPKNSFIDIEDFLNEDDLFNSLSSMKMDEYLERLNLCIDVYNSAIKSKAEIYHSNASLVVDKIVDRVL